MKHLYTSQHTPIYVKAYTYIRHNLPENIYIFLLDARLTTASTCRRPHMAGALVGADVIVVVVGVVVTVVLMVVVDVGFVVTFSGTVFLTGGPIHVNYQLTGAFVYNYSNKFTIPSRVFWPY